MSETGFRAEWRHTRAAAAPVVSAQLDLPLATQHVSSAIVSFVDPVGHYLQVTRAVKYGLLVLLVTFTAFFLFEVIAGLHIHPVQYFLVGGALTTFSTCSCSRSVSTWASSGRTRRREPPWFLLLAGYAMVILKARARAVGFAVGLAAQYAILFVILRAEDFALLTGSVALFVLLAAVMVLTRNVDWYGTLEGRSSAEAPPRDLG